MPRILTYSKDSSINGYGEINSVIKQSLFSPASGWGKTSFTQNQGRLERMKNTLFDPSTTLNAADVNYTSTSARQTAVKNQLNIYQKVMILMTNRILYDDIINYIIRERLGVRHW